MCLRPTFRGSRLASASVCWSCRPLFAPVPGQIGDVVGGSQLVGRMRKGNCRDLKRCNLNQVILMGDCKRRKPFAQAAARSSALHVRVFPPVGRKCLLFPPAPHVATSS